VEVRLKYLTLTLSLILGLTTAANANDRPFAVGDVFFCETLKSVLWEWGGNQGFKNFKPEKFKFSIVDEKTIKFGSSSSFKDVEMEITSMALELLYAKGKYSNLVLNENRFGHTTSHSLWSSLQVASCDRF
jgi:hypothetical protein